MRKNIMRTPEEKEKIVLEMINNKVGFHTINKKYNISKSSISKWYYAYKKEGIEGLKSNIGKSCGKHKNMGIHLRKPKTRIEELELELMKKDIEIARLKKGYAVKGVGQEKEFVSIFNKNTK